MNEQMRQFLEAFDAYTSARETLRGMPDDHENQPALRWQLDDCLRLWQQCLELRSSLNV